MALNPEIVRVPYDPKDHQYPKVLYRGGETLTVANDVDEKAALKGGWFSTLSEAVAAMPKAPPPPVPMPAAPAENPITQLLDELLERVKALEGQVAMLTEAMTEPVGDDDGDKKPAKASHKAKGGR